MAYIKIMADKDAPRFGSLSPDILILSLQFQLKLPSISSYPEVLK